MSLSTRFVIFTVIGTIGVGVQLGCVWFLTTVAGLHYLVATPIAVSLTVVHNFGWHRSWTWKDRPNALLATFARFALTNGVLSLLGNMAVMAVLVSGAGASPVVGNAAAIALSGLLNFWLGDVVVFRLPPAGHCPPQAGMQSTGDSSC